MIFQNSLLRVLLYGGTLLLAVCTTVLAGSATWIPNPVSNDWNTSANWTPATIPIALGDVATFGASDITNVSLSQPALISSIIFAPGAGSYTIDAGSNGLVIDALSGTGAPGVENDSGVMQSFVGANMSISGEGSAGDLTSWTVSGFFQFNINATAGSAIFTVQGGLFEFFAASNAANGTFTVNDNALFEFAGHSTAGNATITLNDGNLQFFDQATGGTARFQIFGVSNLDTSAHITPLTVGSIEGDGVVFLGATSLTVGGNNSSRVFSGTVQDGGHAGRTGGSLTKTGSGSLTLSGANTYTGTTTVKKGKLVVANTSGSATGTGAVTVVAGMLGGGGIISGPVTVGTGSGSGAFLAPATGTNMKATFTTQGALTLKSDATYTYTVKAKGRNVQTDKVVANGVTISGASFSFKATIQGALQAGTVLTVISNSSANPISGTFSNLADGSTITTGGNTFQANYEGGDGNDLTLTVVP